jgi:Ca2+-transporting ATPase
MGNALALRSNRESIFSLGFFSNISMLGAIVLTFVLQLGLIYVPFLQGIFATAALTWWELLVSLAASTVIFFAVELDKWRRRRQSK